MKKQNIQFLRMAACLMVFFVHFSQRMQFQGIWAFIGSLGAYGVQLFFVISGYLIANSCEGYARHHTLQYIAKRMVKILPLYYCVVIYYFVVHTFLFRAVPIDETGFGWMRYFLLLNKVVPTTGTYFWDNLGITWTIPCFLCAYVCLPMLLKIIRGFWSAAICCVGVWLFTSRLLWRLTDWWDVLYNLHYFLMGVMCFYCIWENKQILATLMSTIALVYFSIYERDPNMVAALLSTLLIIWTDKFRTESHMLLKILQISDQYSYTMYLGHGIVFVHLLDRYYMGELRPFVAIFGTIAVTVVINRFFEKPIQQLLNEKLNRRLSSKTCH